MSEYKPVYEYDPSTEADPTNVAQSATTVAAAPTNTSAMPSEPQYIEETGRWTFTDADGVSFEYDENLKAWFPMYNEQLLQAQQSVYGETIPDSLESVYAENAKRQKRKKDDTDQDGSHSSSRSKNILQENNNNNDDDDDDTVGTESTLLSSAERAYEEAGLEMIPGRGEGSNKNNNVKNNNNKRTKGNNKEKKPKPISSVFVMGLPLDTDVEEMAEFFKKGGVFMEDDNGNPRIKLYTNSEGQQTGEGLVTYLRHESVALAIDLLDDTEYRPGVERGGRVRVQQAQFKEKEKPTTTPSAATTGGSAATTSSGAGGSVMSEERKKKVQKKYQKMEKKLDWFEDDENLVKADKWNKVCILKHMFTIAELEADPTLLLDLKEDIREECEKVGEVTNVIIYDHHPEGVVSVRFKDKESALLCVKLMNGRFFAGQRVEADIYDGHTKYETTKSKEQIEEEEKQRLDRYAKWLESEEEREKAAATAGTAVSSSTNNIDIINDNNDNKPSEESTNNSNDDDDERTIPADAPTP